MGAPLGPVHLPLLDHSPTDKLVYGRLGKSGTDSLAIAMAVAVVGDVGLIGGDVVAEFANRAQQLVPLGTDLFAIEHGLQPIDQPQRLTGYGNDSLQNGPFAEYNGFGPR